jgi:CubicO group peptidase (beta-lactamase class C family)
VVSVNGETKVAHYRNGSKPADALHVVSVTKSVVSALIGIAIGEKIISGLDATLPELLPRYGKYLTAEEKSITLRQLMSMTAGFPSEARGDKFDKAFERTSYLDRRLGVAARRSFQLFESWLASRFRRSTRSPGSS